MKYKDLHRLLVSYGYNIIRSTKHIIYNNGIKTISVPNHVGKDVNKMLCKNILKQVKETNHG